MADIYQCNVESGFILDEISRVMENMFQFLDAGLSKERDSVEFANANNLASKETARSEILRCRELGSLQDSTQNLGENQTHSVSLSEEFPRIDVYTDAEEDEIGIRVDTDIKDGEDDTISYSDDYSLEFNRSTHLDVVDQTMFSTYSNSGNSLKEEIYEQLDSCQTASSYVSADENINKTENDSDEAEYAGSCVSKNISDSATNRTYTCNYVPKTVKERDKHEVIGVNDEYNDDDDDDDDANYDDLSFDNETDATEIDESVFADDSDDYAIDMGVVCEDFEFHSNSKHSDSPSAEERNDVNVRLLAIKENQPMVKFELESINEETLESKSSEILEIENEAAEMKKIAVQIKHWAEKIEKEVVKIENVTEEIGQNIEQDVYMETKDEEIQKNSEVIRKDDQNDNELGEDESKTVQVENDCSEIDMKETNSVWLTDDERELIASQSRMEFLEELSVNYSILQRFLLISDDPTTGAMILPVVRWMWDIFKRMQY
ncbi:protein PFC0760c-like [Octopus sinensis]|uniref:Protein PFC0760c-like n=1 Tax=Octopus sinensis TaxID=2607531 RepID=A0A6P7U611_9MOLL|nr:protein PFC0760c-like [Octopus sinensis]